MLLIVDFNLLSQVFFICFTDIINTILIISIFSLIKSPNIGPVLRLEFVNHDPHPKAVPL
jgi:hypothetical protein